MFCSKCGSENSNGAKFCKECGCALESNNVTTQQGNQKIGKFDISKNKNLILTLAGIVAVCIFGVVIFTIAKNSAVKVNLDNFLTIEVSGYDGYGSVHAEIDWNSVEEKYGKKLSKKIKKNEKYGFLMEYYEPIEMLEDYVDIDISKRNNLSNGEIIEYSWDIDEELYDYLDCKLVSKNGSYTVSNLNPIESFDPFAGVNLEFSGISGYGDALMTSSGDVLKEYNFYIKPAYDLSNGDVVTVSIDEDEEYYISNFGKVPSVFQKTFEVSGLTEYANTYSELSGECIEVMKQEAQDKIYAYTANNYSNNVSLSNLKYYGYVFNTNKNSTDYYENDNTLYLIYSGIVSSSEDYFDTEKVYYPVEFSQILIMDNDYSYNLNGIQGYSYFDNSWYGTSGYINPLLCYLELKGTGYSEVGDGFEKYINYEYITSLEAIADENKELIVSDAKRTIEKYAEDNYTSDSAVTNLEYAGAYFLLSKNDSEEFEKKNKYVVVCSGTVSNSRNRFKTTVVYFPVEYNGLFLVNNEQLVYLSSSDVLGRSSLPDSYYSTDGYIDGEEMFNKIINANREEYSYEVSEELKMFGE